MAGKSREIKGRIRAVGNIQRITKTMQMIATARFQAMLKRSTSAKGYTRKIGQLVEELAAGLAGEGSVRNPLLAAPQPPTGRQLVLVIASNRGLCGAYNASVLRTAMQYVRAQTPGSVDLQVVGKKALGFFRFNRTPVDAFHSQFGETPRYDDVDHLAEQYMASFRAGQYDSVRVVYMAFHSASKQTPEVLRLLPLENPAESGGEAEAGGATAVKTNTEYDFTPSAEQLLHELLPITVKTQLFQCFNEAVVSEQLSRMVAMKAATDAAGRMKKSLNRQFNRARQAAITTELTEIIGGTAALE